jgi:hypothetical protein
MRGGSVRVEKYAAKTEGSVVKARADAYGKTQAARFRASVAVQQRIEQEVRGVLARAGVMAHMNHFYMDFAKKVWALAHTHSREVACNEIGIALEAWRRRGLDLSLLETIRDMYVRCVEAAVQPFRLDVSLLDGPDVLV